MNRLTNALFWGFYLLGLAVSLVIEALVIMAFYGTLAVCSTRTEKKFMRGMWWYCEEV